MPLFLQVWPGLLWYHPNGSWFYLKPARTLNSARLKIADFKNEKFGFRSYFDCIINTGLRGNERKTNKVQDLGKACQSKK
jgi:hypothetical protein